MYESAHCVLTCNKQCHFIKHTRYVFIIQGIENERSINKKFKNTHVELVPEMICDTKIGSK